MLDDWEGRRWAGLVERLSVDPELTRSAVTISRGSRCRQVVQEHFYPGGYLISALGYMLLATGHPIAAQLFWFVLIGSVGGAICAWMVFR